MGARFFKSPDDLRKWFAAHHAKAEEIMIGFHKTKTGSSFASYRDALDLALVYGWIDGVRHSLGPDSYQIRFTPRKAKSKWSRVNIKRAEELKALGRLTPTGLKAFVERDAPKSIRYAYEEAPSDLSPARAKTFAANKGAWAFFNAQAPSYRRVITHWIERAQKEETRQKRFASALEASAKGRRLDDKPTKKPG